MALSIAESCRGNISRGSSPDTGSDRQISLTLSERKGRKLLDIRTLERALFRGHRSALNRKFPIFAFTGSSFQTFRLRFVTRPVLFMAIKEESNGTSLVISGNSTATLQHGRPRRQASGFLPSAFARPCWRRRRVLPPSVDRDARTQGVRRGLVLGCCALVCLFFCES